MNPSMTSLQDSPEESHTYIGVVVSVCGNILISVALNLQKYAHNKLQESTNSISDSNGTLPYSSPHIPNDDGSFANQKSIPEEDSTDYLKSKLWWAGISLMVIGEIGNFVAYGFAPASTIAPLGTTTLVFNVILAPLLLKERFRFRDILGVMFAVFGATIVVLSSKREEIKLSPDLVVEYLTSMEAIIYYSITGGLILILTVLSPRWGSKSILIDLGLVALYGAYTVLSTKSVSSLLSLTFYKMFTYPVSYVLLFVLVSTAVIQIKYLNKALQRFDATAVIPTQFVLFTVSAIIGSAVLYRDFDDVYAEQFVHFVFGCIIEFLGVYLITANRRNSDIKIAGDESTMSSHGGRSRTSSIQSEHEQDIESAGDHDTDTLYSHVDMPVTDTTPLLVNRSQDKHKTDDHVHGSDRYRRSSVFRGISLVSQLAGMGDNSYESSSHLSSSVSSKRDKALHTVQNTVGHILGGIIPAAKHHFHDDEVLATSMERNSSVPMAIPQFLNEERNAEQDEPFVLSDDDVDPVDSRGGIKLRRSSTSLRRKRDDEQL
ncbi:hypothetical protein K450DRAFT_259619 [Umbelopsis ramanniana AG]|uniref:DUF803-domain-containing protein n=1 Tax=Umbelopsis ramanniana AG TaxID=1314678 RepID=A0AAD5H8R2_UMBRA|nr:uncharacterized protein K450DRAFT_259619 [Umbelopsis ramanniana AG]KAI8575880.1 hypothetical protein K450DRAFT_259619 [Umbelopsis ramanniana AG]